MANRPGQKIKMTSIDELLCVPSTEGTTDIEVEAIYPRDNIDKTYKISMYEDVSVVQNINVSPKTLEAGNMKWQ